MDKSVLIEAKRQVLEDLHTYLPNYADRLNSFDPRLMLYIEDAISNNGSHANLYELLGIRKEWRLMDSYELSVESMHRSLRAIEGQWNRNGWIKGGLRFDTPRGNQHVRLMPYQVWCLFGIYAFMVDVDMEKAYSSELNLLPTEFKGENGNVWDKRRLNTEAHLFQTRKSGKTELGAAIDFTEVTALGPANALVAICCNSKEQAEIAFKSVKNFAYDIDPTCLNRMGGKFFKVSERGMKWQAGYRMKGEVRPLTAGSRASKRKDGWNCYVVHADEHGSADYTNGHSDMQALVDVMWGSVGTRREKLLLHTTTAGLAINGPYKEQLTTVENLLLEELNYPLGQPCRTEHDEWFAFLLQLDKWEITDDLDQLNNEELFKKVNRSIGTTVQPNYYRTRLREARLNENTKREVLTKDFNIWQGSTVSEWIKPEQVRELQTERRIDDCTYEQGWHVFAAFDFSHGDDFDAVSFLAYNQRTREYFADCDAWVNREAFNKSPYRPLYEKWEQEGWLHVSGENVVEPSAPITRIMELDQKGVNFIAFGYDAYQSKEPILLLKEWLINSLGFGQKDADAMVRPVSQTLASYNAAVQKIEYCIDGVVTLHFSPSPLWPFEFGNCMLLEDPKMGNRKPVKRSANAKVDNIQCLASCFILEESTEI